MTHHDAAPHDARSRKRRLALMRVFFAAALLVGYGLFVWQFLDAHSLASAREEKRLALASKARTVLRDQLHSTMRLAAQPLGWMVRRDMLAADFSQVRRTFNRLAEDPRVRQLMLVRNDGKILVCTDRTMEGREFDSYLRDSYRHATGVSMDRTEDGLLRVVIPLPGDYGNIGTVILSYQAEELKE